MCDPGSCPGILWGKYCSGHSPPLQTSPEGPRRQGQGLPGPCRGSRQEQGLVLEFTQMTPSVQRRWPLEGITVAPLGTWGGRSCDWLTARGRSDGRAWGGSVFPGGETGSHTDPSAPAGLCPRGSLRLMIPKLSRPLLRRLLSWEHLPGPGGAHEDLGGQRIWQARGDQPQSLRVGPGLCWSQNLGGPGCSTTASPQ